MPNKKQKILSCLFFLFLFSQLFGCDGYENTPQGNVIRGDYSYNDTGVLYKSFDKDKKETLRFFDFSSLKSVIMCTRPNCKHNDAKTCFALKERIFPFIYNDMFYWFEYDTYYDENNEIIQKSFVKCCDITGNGEKTVATFEGHILEWSPFECVFIKNNMLYFVSEQRTFEDNITTNESAYCFFSYDFEKDYVEKIYELASGYNVSLFVYGIAKENLYYSYYYTEDDIDVMDYIDQPAEDFNKHFLETSNSVSVINGGVNSCEYSNILYAYENWLVYDNEGTDYIVNIENNTEQILFNDLDEFSITTFSDNVFKFTDNEKTYFYDFKKGKLNSIDINETILIRPICKSSGYVFAGITDFSGSIKSDWVEERYGYIKASDYEKGKHDKYILLDEYTGGKVFYS